MEPACKILHRHNPAISLAERDRLKVRSETRARQDLDHTKERRSGLITVGPWFSLKRHSHRVLLVGGRGRGRGAATTQIDPRHSRSDAAQDFIGDRLRPRGYVIDRQGVAKQDRFLPGRH